ncbi:MAG: hypothetical protein Q4F34_07910 [Prevotellaceae bacterium]|nr:hypothetical protein [Prevotellaceae bacterium]
MRKNYIKPLIETVNIAMQQIMVSGSIIEGDSKTQLGKENNDDTDEGFGW